MNCGIFNIKDIFVICASYIMLKKKKKKQGRRGNLVYKMGWKVSCVFSLFSDFRNFFVRLGFKFNITIILWSFIPVPFAKKLFPHKATLLSRHVLSWLRLYEWFLQSSRPPFTCSHFFFFFPKGGLVGSQGPKRLKHCSRKQRDLRIVIQKPGTGFLKLDSWVGILNLPQIKCINVIKV